MTYVAPLLLIVGALIAMSSFIVARKPSAAEMFAKVAPYQGFLGLGLLALAGWELYNWAFMEYPGLGERSLLGLYFKGIENGNGEGKDMMAGVALLGVMVCSLLIGFMLGMGIIAALTPGEGYAEKKGLALQKKMLALSVPIGLVGLVFAVMWIAHHPGM
jgi:hypothetical protein